MKENLNMDKAFRDKLEGFSAPPPTHVLKNVMGQMATLRRKKRRAYIGWTSAAAVVVFAFIAGWYINDNTNKLTSKIAETANEQTVSNPVESNAKESENKKELDRNIIADIRQEKENNSKRINTANNNVELASSGVMSETEQEFEKENEKNNRFTMDFMKRLNAVFHKKYTHTNLKKSIKVIDKQTELEPDKILLAENARNYNSLKNTEKGWKIGAHISPGYSSYEANHSGHYSETMTNSTSSGNGNVSAGFSVQYKTNKKIRVESGVYYAKNGQKSGNSLQLFSKNQEFDMVFAAPGNKSRYANAVNLNNGQLAMNSTAGVINFKGTPKGAEVLADVESANPQFANSLLSTGEFSQVFDFIEIPLYLRYRILNSKLGIEVMGGMSAGFIVANNAYIDNSYGVQNIGSTQDISTTNLSGTVGLGFNYGLGSHFSVALEPRVNYYLNSINKNPEVDFRPYRVGVYTGLYYEF